MAAPKSSNNETDDQPTYACCGTSAGIPTEFHSYQGLPHGFGLGTGTVAEGWIEDAVRFWETNTKN